MNVKCISITKPILAEVSNAEGLILYIARVSSDQKSTKTGLIRFLIRNGHWSPFEHAHMTLEIETSRAIGTQILRHRSFAFQEFSQRYAHASGIEIHEARVNAGETNRQGSVETDDEAISTNWNVIQNHVSEFAFEQYQQALDMGIAPELARMVLPLATKTKIYMTGSIRSWIHYLGDGPGGRTNPHVQKEHRLIAEAGKEIFSYHFPIIAEALEWL